MEYQKKSSEGIRIGLLSILPPPPGNRTGWPWTEESDPKIYDPTPFWPKISIITTNLNQKDFIEETIRSVILQNYLNIEYLIIDGGSSDGSDKVISKYQNHIQYFVSEKDKGIYDAMNKGILASTGEWLLFLGAEDVLNKGVLGKIFSSVISNQYDLINGKVSSNNKIFGHEFRYDTFLYEVAESDDPIIHQYTHHQGTLIKRDLFTRYGLYNGKKYKIGADIDFFIKVLGDKNIRVLFVDVLITKAGDTGISKVRDDLVFRLDYPDLILRNFHITINKNKYLKNQSKYYFHKVYAENILEGILGLIKIALITGEWNYYFKNMMYWLKKRLF